jgi:hypothetical protein
VPETTTKQVFAIIGIKNEPATANKLRSLGVKSLPLGDRGWLAVYGGTTREFAEALAACRTEFLQRVFEPAFPRCGGGRRPVRLCGRCD